MGNASHARNVGRLRLIAPDVTPADLATAEIVKRARRDGFNVLADALVNMMREVDAAANASRRQPSARVIMLALAQTVSRTRVRLDRGEL